MERLTLHDFAEATGAPLTQPAFLRTTFERVGFDSRTARTGDLFFAFKGERHDGNRFIAEALQRGAVAAVTDSADPVVSRRFTSGCGGIDARETDAAFNGPLFRVPDVAAALARFAGWYRSLLDALVIGVTGSVGKTTTRELIHAALGGEPASVRSRKNFNNALGVPLTLLDVDRHHRFAVVEMGADRPGAIRRLSQIARPEIGVVTRLGVAHIETFGSEQAIVAAKGELLEELPAGGFAVLPGDQEQSRTLAKRCSATVVTVGHSEDCTHRVTVRDFRPGRLTIDVDGTRFEIHATGRHFAIAAGMAVATARRLGCDDRSIARGLKSFEPVAGRCRVALSEPWTVVDDSYNANPDSMNAAIEALAEWPARGRRVLVCGDMYGLGEKANAEHIEIGRRAAARGVNLVAAIGDFAGQIAHGACRSGMEARCLAQFAGRDAAAEWLATVLRPGDVVWVKASRPLELERLVADLVAAQSTPARRAA